MPKDQFRNWVPEGHPHAAYDDGGNPIGSLENSLYQRQSAVAKGMEQAMGPIAVVVIVALLLFTLPARILWWVLGYGILPDDYSLSWFMLDSIISTVVYGGIYLAFKK